MSALIDGQGDVWIQVGHDEFVTLSAARNCETLQSKQNITDEYGGQTVPTTLPWDPKAALIRLDASTARRT